jgi:hypothetical protein
MKYVLGILDRIVLVQILSAAPRTGSYLYHEEFARVANEVSIPQFEQDAIDFRKDEGRGGFEWEREKETAKELEIPECIERIIVEGLKGLDSRELLEPPHIPTYKLFVLPWDERHPPDGSA